MGSKNLEMSALERLWGTMLDQKQYAPSTDECLTRDEHIALATIDPDERGDYPKFGHVRQCASCSETQRLLYKAEAARALN